jgi:hypothetical protein
VTWKVAKLSPAATLSLWRIFSGIMSPSQYADLVSEADKLGLIFAKYNRRDNRHYTSLFEGHEPTDE